MSEPTTPSVFSLLPIVFNSILEVFLLCIAGYILAIHGILDKKTQKQINHLNISLFTPGLLFSKVAFSLSPKKLGELWIVPIFFVVVTVVSMLVAYALSCLAGLKKSQRSFTIATAMFMNCNTLPIALMQNLVVTVPVLKWRPEDSEDSMLGRAVTYIMLFFTLSMVVRWSFGVQLLSQADNEVTSKPLYPPHSPSHLIGISDPDSSECISPSDDLPRWHRFVHWINDFMTPPLWASFLSIVVACVPRLQHVLETELSSVKGALEQAGNCCIPLTLVVLGAYFYVPPEEQGGDTGYVEAQAVGGVEVKAGVGQRRRWSIRSLLGLRQPILLAADTEGSLPSLLGSGLHTYPDAPFVDNEQSEQRRGQLQQGEQAQKHFESCEGEAKTVWSAVLARMVVTPVVLIPLLVLFTRLKCHVIFEDPIFIVTSVLIISSPPALTLAQITHAASGEAFERLISRTLFWSYCALTPPTTIGFVILGIVMARQ